MKMKKSSSLSELEKKNLAADKRLQRTYGITLADYDRMLKKQNGGCWICGKPPKENKRLHVDHCHKTVRLKPQMYQDNFGMWIAKISDPFLVTCNKLKSSAIKEIKASLKKESVRGLLCWRCNTGLQKWRDNPEHLKRAALYLEEYKASNA